MFSAGFDPDSLDPKPRASPLEPSPLLNRILNTKNWNFLTGSGFSKKLLMSTGLLNFALMVTSSLELMLN